MFVYCRQNNYIWFVLFTFYFGQFMIYIFQISKSNMAVGSHLWFLKLPITYVASRIVKFDLFCFWIWFATIYIIYFELKVKYHCRLPFWSFTLPINVFYCTWNRQVWFVFFNIWYAGYTLQTQKSNMTAAVITYA